MSKEKAQAQESTEVVTTVQLPELPADFASSIGAGMEGVDKDSIAIPFLVVIQKTSPQVDESDAKFIESARPGMFINTVTEELMDGKESITLLPCAFRRVFLRWGPRNGPESGFKGEFTPEEATQLVQSGAVVEFENKLFYPTKDGEVDPKKCDLLADTRVHYCLMIDQRGIPVPVVLSLASTQIKKSKQLIAILGNAKVQHPQTKALVTPPTWTQKIKVSTVVESNDKGSWYGVRVESAGFEFKPEFFKAGREFYDLVASGRAEVKFDDVAPTAAPETEGEGF